MYRLSHAHHANTHTDYDLLSTSDYLGHIIIHADDVQNMARQSSAKKYLPIQYNIDYIESDAMIGRLKHMDAGLELEGIGMSKASVTAGEIGVSFSLDSSVAVHSTPMTNRLREISELSDHSFIKYMRRLLVAGIPVLMFSSTRGIQRKRILHITKRAELKWRNFGPTVSLGNIIEVVEGHKTPMMLRNAGPGTESLCFSLITTSRSVDMQVSSKAKRDEIVYCFRRLTNS